MIKRISLKKILVSSCALFALLLVYLIPKENELEISDIPQSLEYSSEDIVTNDIFLLNQDNYLSKTSIAVSNNDLVEDKAKELLQLLITNGPSENKIPNGFKAIIPSDTNILAIQFNNGILKVDFSKDLLDVKKELEEKMISAIVYTLTSIEDIKGVIIYVEGDILTKLPQTQINLPSTLTRDFGINKEYDLNNFNDISKVTVYYLDKYNDNYYYVPVTKYLNDKREKINIIIDELSSTPLYNSNLMSFLNSNTKLLVVEEAENSLDLTFNEYLFQDVDEKDILEEVIYTICLSIKDNYDVGEVVFKVGDEEICKTVLKTIN